VDRLIERKKMSTKTTFKRIALATVATLGFGILSVVPSHAAGMLADSLLNAADGSVAVASTATVGGSAATAKIVWSGIATSAADTATVTGTILSVPATSGVYGVTFQQTAGITTNVSAYETVTGSTAIITPAFTAPATNGRVTKYITANFTPDVAGTYVIALKSAGGVNNSTVTWTITASARPAATAAASSVVFISKALVGSNAYCAGNTPGNTPNIQDNYIYYRYACGSQTLDDALVSLADLAPASGVWSEPIVNGTAGSIVGSGMVHFSNKTILTANNATAVPMTASISGHGYVRVTSIGGATSYGTTVTEAAAAGYTPFDSPNDFGRMKFFDVISDGTTGPATITISAGGVVLGTVDMMFTGPSASLNLSTSTAGKLSKNYIGSGDTATVKIVAKDAAGNSLAASGITAVTGDENGTAVGTIASAAIVGDVVTVTGGLVSGKVTWTVVDADKKHSVTFVTYTTKKTGTFVTSFDAASYGPGEKVTWKIVGTDSNGSPVADGPRAVFASVDANMSVAYLGVGALPSLSPSFVDGVATGSFYAPAAGSGTFNMTTTIGAADSTYATASAAALAAKTVSSFTISNAPVDAATDAANQAYDAANAATDAALAAADAADAATSAAQDASDAVAALSATVAKLVASLKAQITSLTNLVIKIQKKVKA
jgi:trimeric autotransporter adhesin